MNTKAAYKVKPTRNVRHVDSVYDVPDALVRQAEEGRSCTVKTMCTVKRKLAILMFPSVIFLITAVALLFWDIDKLTVVKLSVIIILISVAALNITLVGAVAMTWKYWKRQRTKLASARVAQQGASIAMNTNTTCMANSVRQEEAIQMTENPAYAAITDYCNAVNVP